MTFETGSIILVKDYQLPTKVKDKFFIVIGFTENKLTLMSMTTSQIYFDTALIKQGIIKDRDMSVYCFLKGKIIGKNGFCFHKNTFISHRSNIHEFSSERLDSMNIEYMDCLIKEEIENVLYYFYKYENTPKKYRGILENILKQFALP